MTERSAMESWEEARAERNQALKSLSSHLSSSSSDMDCRNNNMRRPTCPLLDTNLDLEGHSILPIKRQVVVAEWQKGKKRQGIGRTAPLGLVCPKPIAKGHTNQPKMPELSYIRLSKFQGAVAPAEKPLLPVDKVEIERTVSPAVPRQEHVLAHGGDQFTAHTGAVLSPTVFRQELMHEQAKVDIIVPSEVSREKPMLLLHRNQGALYESEVCEYSKQVAQYTSAESEETTNQSASTSNLSSDSKNLPKEGHLPATIQMLKNQHKLEDAFTSIGQKLMGLATKNLGSEMQKIPWSRAIEMLLRNLKLSEPPAITSDINDCTKDSPAGCFIQKLDMMEARYPEITAVCNRSFDCMSHTLPHLKPDIFEDNKYCLSSDLFEDNDEHSRADNVHVCQGIEDSDSTFFVNRSGCKSTNTLKGKEKDPYSWQDSQGIINLDSHVTQNWAVSPVKNLSVGGFKWSSLSDQWCSRIAESGTYSDNERCLRARKQVQEIQKADPAYFIPQIDLLPADSPDVETHQNFLKGQEENTVIEPLLLSLLDRWSPESNKSNHCYGEEFEKCFESREMQEIGEGSCAYLLAEIDRFNVTPDFETQDILCQKKDEENIVGISYYPSSKQKNEHRETRQSALISEEDFVRMDEMQNINIEYNCDIPHWGHSHYSESCHKNLSMLIGFNGEFSDTHFTSLSESVECHIIKSMAVNDILVTEELSMSIEDMLSGSSFTGDTYPLVIYESPHLEGIISHSNASEIIDSITPPKLHNLALDTALWSETYLS